MATDEPQDVEQRLEQLLKSIGDLADLCQYRSSMRVARETQRLAKQERKVIPYLQAAISLMNSCLEVFDPESGVNVALECIALLESDDHARQFQPDLPEDHYQYMVSRISTCAYDHLAMHTAEKEGHNSDGVHDCISDGLFVCRRTGKLECIACFREYATDVYQASDDIEMALHHARAVATTPPLNPDNNRQWAGQRSEAKLLLLSGQLEAALEAAKRCWTLVDTWHTVFQARLETKVLLEIILLLLGRQDELPEIIGSATDADSNLPASDEFPLWEMQSAQRDAIAACLKQDYPAAIDTLTKWDRRLTSQHCLSTWFDIRLQLIAVCALSGNQARVKRLAAQLDEKAKHSRDWLTQRILTRLLDDAEPRSPWATIAPLSSGPFAPIQPAISTAQARRVELSEESATANQDSADLDAFTAAQESDSDMDDSAETHVSSGLLNSIPPEHANSPIAPLARKIQEAVENSDVQAFASIYDELLAWTPEKCTDPYDAAWLIYLAQIAGRFMDRLRDIWPWALRFLDAYPQYAGILNVVADLGNTIRLTTPEGQESPVDVDTLEKWFRSSLDLDPNRARSFGRAGDFYQTIDRYGDAERCYARGFRLDRANAQLALSLAEIYANTDRVRDALTVLDMCLRAGCEAPVILWRAGILAYRLNQFDVMLTYYTKYEESAPDESWTQYHRAVALLEIGNDVEASFAMAIEAERNTDSPFAILSMEAAIAAKQSKTTETQEKLAELLKLPLSGVNYIPREELMRLLVRVYEAMITLPAGASVRKNWEQRLLQAALMPDRYFDQLRESFPEQEDINFYICRIVQPLGDEWDSFSGRLPDEEGWPAYQALWGVLAPDEETAKEQALEWQSRCHPLEATCSLDDVDVQSEGYTDKPGIIWQGARAPLGENPDDENQFQDDDEDDDDDDNSDDDDDTADE
jgi:tetratricopeptide (TPR) repeat protein